MLHWNGLLRLDRSDRLCHSIVDFPYATSVLGSDLLGVHLMEEHNLSETVAKEVWVSLHPGQCKIEPRAILLLSFRLEVKDIPVEHA